MAGWRVLTGRSFVFASRRWARIVGAIVAVFWVGGCLQTASDSVGRAGAADPLWSLDLKPRAPQGGGDGPVATSAATAPVAYYGSPNATGETAAPQPDPSGDYTLDFDNTPIAAAAQAVFGDMLKVGYVIDPRVQGSISLSSARPIAKKDVLFAFESALKASNFALLREAPPLIFNNDITANVQRFYWSQDFGYALWVRLYETVMVAR